MAEDQNKDRSKETSSMDEKEQQGSHSRQNQGQNDNPGNFANDPDRAAEAGRKGGQS